MIERVERHFADRVLRIEPADHARILVVGDVHGCLAEFESLLDRLEVTDDDLVICVGDIVDKGPDSAGALHLLRSSRNLLSVRGNGEAKLLRGELSLEGVDEEDRAFVAGWPLVILWEGHMVVHGGLDPRKEVADHSATELLTMRSLEHGGEYRPPYWFQSYRGPDRVFFGHTVSRRPIVTEHALGLDTGCVYGGTLTAFDTREGRLVQIPARRVYRPRNPGEFFEAPTGDEAAPTGDEAPGGNAADLNAPSLYLSRELSELEFQRRVLEQARDDRMPLLERVRFLGILTRNMDDFLMKRIGGLKQQISAGFTRRSPDGRTPTEQWEGALETARALLEAQAACWRNEILPALAAEGIRIVPYEGTGELQREALRRHFETAVMPVLTPLTFDPAHPFPFISNLSLSLAVLTRPRNDEEVRSIFSRVKIPPNRRRLVPLPAPRGVDPEEGASTHGGSAFLQLEEVVAANLGQLFPGVELLHFSTFRVVRNAQVRQNQEVAEDLIEMIEEVLRERRFATVVALQLEPGVPEEVEGLLCERLDVGERELFHLPPPLDFRSFEELLELDRPDLKFPVWTPQPHPDLALPTPEMNETPDLFAALRRRDVLVHHPYHSFRKSVHRFVERAAQDPDVLAIKSSIYRTATESPFVESLIRAARNGKQVAVMVELKARFDEENNLRWAERLEEEGIHVAYGTIGYKTHAKVTLVVREEEDGLRYYSHVGTGNYHSETAERYTDLGLLTADREIGEDLARLFNYFTGHTRHERYHKLLVAPVNMREGFTRLIRREREHALAGREGRILAKMNSLEDPKLVRELYRASQAGVSIDLVVRGICRLRPGLEGISETVRVRSLVGRFLEHSRIFCFANDGEPEYYLGSADWMTRNLDHRVETVVPVEDPRLREELRSILELMLADERLAWEMEPDGSYRCVSGAVGTPGEDELDSQAALMERAARGATAAVS